MLGLLDSEENAACSIHALQELNFKWVRQIGNSKLLYRWISANIEMLQSIPETYSFVFEGRSGCLLHARHQNYALMGPTFWQGSQAKSMTAGKVYVCVVVNNLQ